MWVSPFAPAPRHPTGGQSAGLPPSGAVAVSAPSACRLFLCVVLDSQGQGRTTFHWESQDWASLTCSPGRFFALFFPPLPPPPSALLSPFSCLSPVFLSGSSLSLLQAPSPFSLGVSDWAGAVGWRAGLGAILSAACRADTAGPRWAPQPAEQGRETTCWALG